jgi:hypothetical protein
MQLNELCTLLLKLSLLCLSLLICRLLKARLQRGWQLCSQRLKRLWWSGDERSGDVDSNFEDIWYDWLESVGVDIDCEIEENFERSQYMLDMDDGTHAQWRESQLGVLLVLTREEVEALVLARQKAKDNDINSWLTLTSWVMGFTTFLDQCLCHLEDTEDPL